MKNILVAFLMVLTMGIGLYAAVPTGTPSLPTDANANPYPVHWTGSEWNLNGETVTISGSVTSDTKSMLYYYLNPIAASAPSADSIGLTNMSLYTLNFLYGFNQSNSRWDRLRCDGVSDNEAGDDSGVLHTTSHSTLYDATTDRWNKMRGDTTYGIDVDVTRIGNDTIVAGGDTINVNAVLNYFNIGTETTPIWSSVNPNDDTNPLSIVNVTAHNTMTCTSVIVDSIAKTIDLGDTYNEVRLFSDTVCSVTFIGDLGNPAPTQQLGDIIADDWIPYVNVAVRYVRVITYYASTAEQQSHRIRIRGLK